MKIMEAIRRLFSRKPEEYTDFQDTEGEAFVKDMAASQEAFERTGTFPSDAQPFPIPPEEKPKLVLHTDANTGAVIEPFPETLPVLTQAVEPFPVSFEAPPAHAEALPFPETQPLITKGSEPRNVDGLVGFDGKVDAQPFPESWVPAMQEVADTVQPFPEESVEKWTPSLSATAQPFPETETPTEMIRLESGQSAQVGPFDVVNQSDSPLNLTLPAGQSDTPLPNVPCSPVDGVSYEEIRKEHRTIIDKMQEALDAKTAEVRAARVEVGKAHRATALAEERLALQRRGYEKILACVRSWYSPSDKRWLAALKREYLK